MSNLAGTAGRRRIYLMRHGHVDYFAPEVRRTRNIRDVTLTPRGRLEAEAAARALVVVPFDRAICSGLPRTRETAEIVLAARTDPLTLEVEPDLEEIHGGRAQAINRAELAAIMTGQFDKAADEGATMLEGGEAFASAQARALSVVGRLLSEPDWAQCLIVAHEGINRLILSWAAGAGLLAARAFEQDTGCINVIDFDMTLGDDGKPGPDIERALIKAINLTPYNYLKHGMNLTSLEAIFARGETEV